MGGACDYFSSKLNSTGWGRVFRTCAACSDSKPHGNVSIERSQYCAGPIPHWRTQRGRSVDDCRVTCELKRQTATCCSRIDRPTFGKGVRLLGEPSVKYQRLPSFSDSLQSLKQSF